MWYGSHPTQFYSVEFMLNPLEKNLAALQNAPKSFLKVVDNQRGVITTHPIHKGQFVVQYAEEFGTIKPA